MHVLAIETSSARGGVALSLEGGRVDALELPEGLVHGREVLSHVEALTRRNALEPGSLDAVAVSAGPGSYTGIRVGVTVAKTLAYGLRVPLRAVSSLRVIAENARTGAGEANVVVVLDGKQGHLYRAVFGWRDGVWQRLLDDGVERREQLVAGEFPGIATPARLLGDGADVALEALGATADSNARYTRWPAPDDWPRAEGLLALAMADLAAGLGVLEGEQVHGLQPVYLRVSEAERRWEARRRQNRRELP